MALTKKLYFIKEIRNKTGGTRRTRGIRIYRGSATSYGVVFLSNGTFIYSDTAVSNKVVEDDIAYLKAKRVT